MELLFVYSVFAFGLYLIVGRAKISKGPRDWLAARGSFGLKLAELVECPMCFGTWTGIGVSGYLLASAHVEVDWLHAPLYVFMLACITAATNEILNTVYDYLHHDDDDRGANP